MPISEESRPNYIDTLEYCSILCAMNILRRATNDEGCCGGEEFRNPELAPTDPALAPAGSRELDLCRSGEPLHPEADSRELDPCRSREPLYPELEEAARLFKAVADETRLSILRQLREQGEVCACNFMACCELAQPTVSHHLKVLREAGLVQTEKRGLWVYYTLNPSRLEQLRKLLP